MVCKRIISVLTFNEGNLFRTKNFHPDYLYTSNFLDFWSVDEIVALDITRAPTQATRNEFLNRLTLISKRCFVPLSAGGGIASLSNVDELFGFGVDKIVINSKAVEDPSFIETVAKKYGSQAVLVSIDAKKIPGENQYRVFIRNGTESTSLDPVRWAKQVADLGAGEIMITSMGRDGSLVGYDRELSKAVVQAVGVPVLLSGGAGNWQHFFEGLHEIGAEGVCTTNIYHFTETSMISAKEYLAKKNIMVRI